MNNTNVVLGAELALRYLRMEAYHTNTNPPDLCALLSSATRHSYKKKVQDMIDSEPKDWENVALEAIWQNEPVDGLDFDCLVGSLIRRRFDTLVDKFLAEKMSEINDETYPPFSWVLEHEFRSLENLVDELPSLWKALLQRLRADQERSSIVREILEYPSVKADQEKLIQDQPSLVDLDDLSNVQPQRDPTDVLFEAYREATQSFLHEASFVWMSANSTFHHDTENIATDLYGEDSETKSKVFVGYSMTGPLLATAALLTSIDNDGDATLVCFGGGHHLIRFGRKTITERDLKDLRKDFARESIRLAGLSPDAKWSSPGLAMKDDNLSVDSGEKDRLKRILTHRRKKLQSWIQQFKQKAVIFGGHTSGQNDEGTYILDGASIGRYFTGEGPNVNAACPDINGLIQMFERSAEISALVQGTFAYVLTSLSTDVKSYGGDEVVFTSEESFDDILNFIEQLSLEMIPQYSPSRGLQRTWWLAEIEEGEHFGMNKDYKLVKEALKNSDVVNREDGTRIGALPLVHPLLPCLRVELEHIGLSND